MVVVRMLRSVVTDGTGAAADIEGYEVCGKTSTAEIASEEGGYKKEVYNIGFCGFVGQLVKQFSLFCRSRTRFTPCARPRRSSTI